MATILDATATTSSATASASSSSSSPSSLAPLSSVKSLVVHCRRADFDVYIGRPTKCSTLRDAGFGNPFKMKDKSDQERQRVIQQYRRWLLTSPDLMQRARRELCGKKLGCWCAPLDCHGHTLAAIANGQGALPTIADAEDAGWFGNIKADLDGSKDDGVNAASAAESTPNMDSEAKYSTFPPFSLIDIGVNLHSKEFARDAGEVVLQAAKAGVSPLVLTGTSLKSSKIVADMAHRLSSEDSQLYYTAGVHPHEAKHWTDTMATELRSLALDPRCVAIGECGLDFNRNFSPCEDQEHCFAAQLELACELNMPLFCHEREAFDAFVKILLPFLERAHFPQIVVHCFTGNAIECEAYLNMDERIFIGLTGTVCKATRGLNLRQEVIPLFAPTAATYNSETKNRLNRLMLETDAPFMHPNPPKNRSRKKSARCEPRHVVDVCLTVASVLSKSPSEVAAVTTDNARRFFRLNEAEAACFGK